MPTMTKLDRICRFILKEAKEPFGTNCNENVTYVLSKADVGAGMMLSTCGLKGKKMWPYLVLHCSCRSPSLETDAFLLLLSSNMSVHTTYVIQTAVLVHLGLCLLA